MNAKPWLKNYDAGVPESLAPYPNVSIFSLLEDSARKYPQATCTILKGAKISYAQMNEMTDRLAAGLASLGVKKGDRVGIMMPNVPQFVLAYFAILKAGGVVVAMNPTYPAPELVHPLNDAEIEVALVMSKFYDTVNAARGQTKLKKVIVTNVKEALPPVLGVLFGLAKEKKEGHHVAALHAGDVWLKDLLAKFTPADRPKVNVTGDDRALFQYSGGTTGTPKAAVALHKNIVANALQMKAWLMPKESGEVMLMAIPLFHVYGMIAGMCFTILGANPLVMIPDARDLKDLFENIHKYRPTLFPGVPRLYNAINNNPDVLAGKVDLKSIRACISGSAPLLADTKSKFESLAKGAVVFEGFGMSEAPTATHCNPVKGKNKEGSIGMPLPDMEVKIIDLDDGKTELGLGEIGELIVRGPQVMWGYHNMTTETQNTLRSLGDGGAPWLYTGDIARMDEDGYFYIVDRKKELIKAGGFQVWPRDIEEVLTQNPKVLEAAAAGVPHPDLGETVKAWVVLKPDQQATEPELKQWCTERLAKYKVPYQIEFRTELPKTAVFKVLRRELVRQHKETAKK